MTNIDHECGSERTVQLSDRHEARLYCGLSEAEHVDVDGVHRHAVSQNRDDVWIIFMWPGEFEKITPAQQKKRIERGNKVGN